MPSSQMRICSCVAFSSRAWQILFSDKSKVAKDLRGASSCTSCRTPPLIRVGLASVHLGFHSLLLRAGKRQICWKCLPRRCAHGAAERLVTTAQAHCSPQKRKTTQTKTNITSWDLNSLVSGYKPKDISLQTWFGCSACPGGSAIQVPSVGLVILS